ncbi:MAG: arginase [Betaproteobacteria bacterium HGW-Betaproteobacteria-7]|jgi:arginase|nr:MAG: arginase [Betaproteobacteria bacterium HGW-Betaproteobacteria-7]
MTDKIRIIGAASGLGAQDQGCEDGPLAFHRSQAWHELEHHPQIDWGRMLFAADSPGRSEIGRIAGLCRRLADEVALAQAAGEFPLVIGGDHSIAIGTWSGVARVAGAPVGLLWIDAHLDSHTPETTYSGAVHGMPLACLLGRGDKRLLGIGRPGAQVSTAHTVVLGPRSYEAEEMDFLRTMGVRIIESSEIAERGFAVCLHEALAIVTAAPAGFGLTLDLDAIDPGCAPGVGSPEPDGLWDGDVLAAVAQLATLPGLRAVEIAEYNPDRDWQGRTARLIAELIAEMLSGLNDRLQG